LSNVGDTGDGSTGRAVRYGLLPPGVGVRTLPIGRFGGLLWLIAASIVLPRTRRGQPKARMTSASAATAPSITVSLMLP
jgi:hypothetical protein